MPSRCEGLGGDASHRGASLVLSYLVSYDSTRPGRRLPTSGVINESRSFGPGKQGQQCATPSQARTGTARPASARDLIVERAPAAQRECQSGNPRDTNSNQADATRLRRADVRITLPGEQIAIEFQVGVGGVPFVVDI